MKIALITMIESNGRSTNDDNGITFENQRYYEDEAILCFENWRKNGGDLSDIPIYTYCPSKHVVSAKTKEKFKELNVTYIEKYHEETEEFESGFINVPFCGMLLERELKEDILIHIDLDMNLIKPIDQTLFDIVCNGKIVVGQYDDISKKDQRFIGEDWDNPLDTGFIISRRDSGFYHYFFNELMKLYETNGDERWQKYCSNVEKYFLEEYVIEKAYNEGKLDIYPIQYYQVGEGYASVNTFPKDRLSNIYFWHEHLYPNSKYDKVRERIAYFKRMKEV
ncbi:hypothetical protein DAY19_03335 [Halobacteriovorax vibrionivorans]|uniref:Nucleotide-diphospho-sugar transferase domain-containing protein n=1 Tax=Halobacteriovorax vibrionivorans TaxID=2152716 RepID=A0ABY0IK12_9BACT|nr:MULTISPECIES: hypothetical protein [Halobacteriovorax]RZF22819.1 hypothetical protein DAY19_03335 [Halobacteriovorax vibrionivorans]TGD47388.1 hypothetical protein EP118_08715 [Halobacteriovorax sp. Y22]